MNLFDLTDKVALVTGASSGLGNNFAKVLAAHGADVVVAARRVERLEALAEEIRKTGRRCFPVQCDVSKEDDIIKMVESVLNEFGKIDILVNNAGNAYIAPAEEHSLDGWNNVVDVTMTGVFLVSKHVGKQMIQQKYGKIINTASMYGLVGNSFFPVASYHATKGGVVNLTRALAAEWGKYNITVNAIGPGFFPSEMTAEAFGTEDFQNYVKANSVLGRPGKEGELDGALVYLASDASSYTTGITIPVDGGWTAL